MGLQSMNRKSLLAGIILGIAVVVSLGIVYIDNIKHYWQFSGGFVQLVVNTNAQAIMTIDTNTLRVGFNTNNTGRSFQVAGRKPATNSSATGASAVNNGNVHLAAGAGGETTIPTSGTGGAGGNLVLLGGGGGSAIAATTNATGGIGGTMTLQGGAAGVGGSLATNSITGGQGGGATIIGGAGGSPSFATTNATGGAGGTVNLTAGTPGTPSAGWSRQTGNGGSVNITATGSGASTRTNSGDGGNVNIVAGNSGDIATAPGNPGVAGYISIIGGAGGTGGTNANGGGIYLIGGNPGAGALPGNTIIGREEDTGVSRGGLQVGPLVAGTTATLTNLLTITAVLDFPSIAAGVVADLPVAFTGAADGDVVTLGVPLSSVTNCTWMGFASNAVVYVRAANGQLVTAQDPNSGTFRIVLQKYQ